MSSLSQWNSRQIHVLQRYCSVHRIPLTPEVVTSLATRYVVKHASERPTATSPAAARPARARCVARRRTGRPRTTRPSGASGVRARPGRAAASR